METARRGGLHCGDRCGGAVEAAAASLVGAMRQGVLQWLEEDLSPDDIAQRLIVSPQGQDRLAQLEDEVKAA